MNRLLTTSLLTTLLFLSCLAAEAGQSRRDRILFTAERISAAEQLVRNNPDAQRGWQAILAEADRQLSKGEIMKLEFPALAYEMTGEEKYADKIRRVLLKTIETETWANDEMMSRTPAWNSELNMAHRSFQIAVAYDAVYEYLSKADRKKIAEGMNRLAVQPALGDWLLEPTRIHCLNSMGHNWWTSCVCNAGLLALVFRDEIKGMSDYAAQIYEVLPQWFSFEGDVLQNKMRTFDRDGGMYESINYANFGIREALIFRQAWANTHRNSKLAPIPELEKLPAFFAHVCYPSSSMLLSMNFGDSHKNITGGSCLMLLYAQGIKDSNILWYLSKEKERQHRESFYLSDPMGLLYMPQGSAPAEPSLAKSQLFSDFGWATIRDSWADDATMLAVKSGHTWNHAHADANSLILFHKGVDIIKDAGNCGYGKPQYREYFFQSEAHNVVLFNGEGQSREQQYRGSMLDGQVTDLLDEGGIRYVLANGIGPMARHLSRNFRHFLWIGNVIYVIDDLKSYEAGHFQWLWHPGGEARKRGIDLIVTNGASSVAIRPLYPRQLAKSDYVHDYPEDLYWNVVEAPEENMKTVEQYYEFHLPALTDRVKGVTAIILKETPDDKDLPSMKLTEGKDWIGVRTSDGSTVTELYINQLADGRLMHMNSWIEAGEWETDAYMLAVVYPEGGKPKDGKVFICYGSSLRRDGKPVYSSLKKGTLVKELQQSR